MTTPPTDQVQQQQSEKELNFRKQEQMFQRQLAAEKARADELERRYEESRRQAQQQQQPDDDDSTDEPYVDHKRLDKKLAKVEQKVKKETQSDIQTAVQMALNEERKKNWINSNSDFYDVLNYADRLAERAPDLAASILEMPDNFERQKLVYKNIKALGLHQDAPKQPTIQDKVDANRRSPFYQPSSVGTAPYSSQGNYSPQGQKEAYDKMQELKARLRI